MVLVIEDNEANMRLVKRVLEFNGYHPIGATTAEEGIALAMDQPPDLVLMDMQLPGMDGVAALEHLRSSPRTRAIPVVALTALALQPDRERLAAAGFDAYLTKPINILELGEQVRLLCEGRTTEG